ncbi:hypothetical protein JOB18_035745 [Solea senegalensis]|uniref:Uncharacterized protein n=1 Tax=Solea senegalensis TaxID=28829 RepID=A0AAV6PNB5_SOLSE|nr:hypothetical protein JOB18_035745 [Solea senegalensis]
MEDMERGNTRDTDALGTVLSVCRSLPRTSSDCGVCAGPCSSSHVSSRFQRLSSFLTGFCFTCLKKDGDTFRKKDLNPGFTCHHEE